MEAIVRAALNNGDCFTVGEIVVDVAEFAGGSPKVFRRLINAHLDTHLARHRHPMPTRGTPLHDHVVWSVVSVRKTMLQSSPCRAEV